MTDTKTKENKAAQNGAKPDKDEQANGRLPFPAHEVYRWIFEGIKRDYGTQLHIVDFQKTRGVDDMIDIVGKMVKTVKQ